MPELPIPNDWVKRQIGRVEFRLPPELANSEIAPKRGASMFLFRHGERAVALSPPEELDGLAGLFGAAARFSATPSRVVTLPQLRLACCRAKADDFRWSMTPDEVRRHTFCVATRKVVGLDSIRRVEFYSRPDLDGILMFENGRAHFSWQCVDSMWIGDINFADKDFDHDLDWIRMVCRSVRFVPEKGGGDK
jgi:hypothetical protein